MDENIYSTSVINRFLKANLFFNDDLLKKYYDKNDLVKFRNRVHKAHPNKTFEKMAYALVTDNIRDILYQTIGELTVFLKPMGDLIVSGGEAFNKYIDRNDRIVASDIDTKFAPRMKPNEKYFGKLQAVKLLLWDKLGQIAKKLDKRIHTRLTNHKSKIGKFIGMNLESSGPHVRRRYNMIKKRKQRNDNKPAAKNIFIDVELFALDLKMRCFNPSKNKIETFNLGGILDIPIMRPGEFGYEVLETKEKGISYKVPFTGRVIVDNRIFIASKKFLLEDVYLMQKLGLRPEKKEKDRQRMVKLAKLIKPRSIKTTDSMDTIIKKVRKELISPKKRIPLEHKQVNMKKAKQVNPYKYKNYTTTPSREKLSKQIVHGLKRSTVPHMNIPGFERTEGNKRFNVENLQWKQERNRAYIKNEFNYRPTEPIPLPEKIKMQETLYGFKPVRDKWVPKRILSSSAAIPFIGLKN
jgi:hypothetical protein